MSGPLDPRRRRDDIRFVSPRQLRTPEQREADRINAAITILCLLFVAYVAFSITTSCLAGRCH